MIKVRVIRESKKRIYFDFFVKFELSNEEKLVINEANECVISVDDFS